MRLIDADELAGKLKRLKERIDKIEKGKETRCLVDVTQVIEYVENAKTVVTMTNENDLIRRGDALRELNGICSTWQDDSKVADIVEGLPPAEDVSREEYEELYRKAQEVNDMANDILSDFPNYIKAVGYVEWLEKIIVDSEAFAWLCEDTNDKEWCEKKCKYASIQAECLRRLYEVSKGGEDK